MIAEQSKFYVQYLLPVAWPARSPDLTAMDFFGATQRTRWITHVTSLEDLRKRFVHSVEGITLKMCDYFQGI
jgi:hypothetical protein